MEGGKNDVSRPVNAILANLQTKKKQNSWASQNTDTIAVPWHSHQKRRNQRWSIAIKVL